MLNPDYKEINVASAMADPSTRSLLITADFIGFASII